MPILRRDAATNDGHVTKYGAEAILARVPLYSGYYGKEPDQLGLTKADALAACEGYHRQWQSSVWYLDSEICGQLLLMTRAVTT